MFEGNQVYTVVVEFDGKKTGKSLYYRRLHTMGLFVRVGDKDTGVVERRFNSDGSTEDRHGPRVIVQEATVTCASESLARYVAHTAQDCGAAAVYIQTGVLIEHVTKTRRDAEIINRIEEKAGKRGRKPVPEKWVCTCLECLTQTEQEVPYVNNCTNCGGLMIHTRKGNVIPLADPGGDVFEAWRAIRFYHGSWEPCPIEPGANKPTVSHEIEIYNTKESQTVDLIGLSSGLLDTLRSMDRDNAFAFLDAIFVARAYDGHEKRIERRVKVITQFMMKGGDATKISFVEPTEPDLIDAAALGVGKVVGWLLRG